MNQIHGIIFDLDGTLGDTLPVCVGAFQDTYRHFTGLELSAQEVEAHFGPSEEGILSRLLPSESGALARYLEAYERLHNQANQPFPGVLQALELLKQRGAAMAIVTGKGPLSAEISMRRMSLNPYVPLVVPGYPDKSDKPACILQVLQSWGLPAAQAAYLGDTPYDMRSAREAGLLALGAAWADTSTLKNANHGSVDALFERVDDFIEWVQMNVAEGQTMDRHKSRPRQV